MTVSFLCKNRQNAENTVDIYILMQKLKICWNRLSDLHFYAKNTSNLLKYDRKLQFYAKVYTFVQNVTFNYIFM